MSAGGVECQVWLRMCRWLGRNSPILKSHILGNQNPHSNVAKGATLEWGTLMTLGPSQTRNVQIGDTLVTIARGARA